MAGDVVASDVVAGGRRMRVGIVTEAGPTIGFGHLGRMVSLHQELWRRGHHVVVDCPGLNEDDAGRFGVGGSLATSVEDTVDLDWTVVDRRRPCTVEQGLLLAAGSRVCLVDDTGPFRPQASLVVDPPTAAHWPPAGGRRLSGCAHVLVRDEFRRASPDPDRGGSVLVTMGGSDPAGLTAPVGGALVARSHRVVAVRGPGFGDRPDGPFEVVGHPDDMASLYPGRSLSVCGFGHSLFEAAVMGVPAVYVAWSDGQIEDAAHFEQLGWARSAGRADDPTAPDRVVALVEEVLGDAGRWQAMSAAGRAAVDGRGPHRVVDAMEELLGGSAT